MMSRYFTSPPPVYAKNWANGQNLVESTKIETSKKMHRKEKKERNKETKLKSIKQKAFPTKHLLEESEQLEKSCLTEEHEQHNYVGYLSEGSQDSKKRRKASPAVESNIKATSVAGNPLRIRFVFKKPKVAEVIVPQEDVCSTSGTDRPSSVSVLDKNLLSTSENDKTATISESKKRKKHKTSKETRYNSLFDELVPPCISMEGENSNNDDWLFSARRQESSLSKSCLKTDEDMVLRDSSLPRFLSEVGCFSLPYTVLF